jgi:hypothetical protein
MAHQRVRPAADELVVLLQRDRAAPVAAEPGAGEDGKAEPRQQQRQPDQIPAEAVRMKALLQQRTEDMRLGQDDGAGDQQNAVAEAGAAALASHRLLGAQRRRRPEHDPDEPERRDEQDEESSHCLPAMEQVWQKSVDDR